MGHDRDLHEPGARATAAAVVVHPDDHCLLGAVDHISERAVSWLVDGA